MGINDRINKSVTFWVECSLRLSCDCEKVNEVYTLASNKSAAESFKADGWKCKRDTFEWVCPACVEAERDQMLDEVKREFDEQE